MRPPQFAGEKVEGPGGPAVRHEASMRPPQFAGEKIEGNLSATVIPQGFNEAPAVRGGKEAETKRKWAAKTKLQ